MKYEKTEKPTVSEKKIGHDGIMIMIDLIYHSGRWNVVYRFEPYNTTAKSYEYQMSVSNWKEFKDV